jgi:hypothetical protein
MGLLGLESIRFGFNPTRFNINSTEYQALKRQADIEQRLVKALTTGENVVTPGATGGQALRKQYLFGELELTSAMQDDAMLVKLMPMKDAKSTLYEWSLQNYTPTGDGFVGEGGAEGASGSFGVNFFDDPVQRMSETMGFLAQGRAISDVAEEVDNIMDPHAFARRGMLTSMFANANVAGYFGARNKSNTQFNGFEAQLWNWIQLHPEDYGIMYDCNGGPLDRYLLQNALSENLQRYGKIDLIMMSVAAKEDSTQLIWPENRNEEGKGGTFGGQFDTFAGPAGAVKLQYDAMLRPNRPLAVEGPAALGAPRTVSTIDANSLLFGGNPFTTCAAASAGTGNSWYNFTQNTDVSAVAAPSLPAGAGMAQGGNQSNHLAAGTYYYGVSTLYQGWESSLYIYGAGNQNASTGAVSGTPTGVTVSQGQIVQLTLDPTQITGIGTSASRNLVKFRVYRAGGPGQSAPTTLSQFQYLQETGIPTSGSTATWDNGMYIPGSDTAFGITRKKAGLDEWAWMNLLPLMEKELPVYALGRQFCTLWFTMPLLRVRRRHIVFYNVGRAN